MKIGNPANYYVQVWPAWWDEPAETAALYQDIFALSLNAAATVKFVPGVGDAAPPWRLPHGDEPATPVQARVAEALTAPFAVTPNPGLAGSAETFSVAPGEPANTVFYVTRDEFAAFRDELAALAESASGATPAVRHDDVADLAVIRFLDARVLSHVSPDTVARA